MSLLTAAEKVITYETRSLRHLESALCDEMIAFANEFARNNITQVTYFSGLRMLGRIIILVGVRHIGSPTKTLLKLWQATQFQGFEDAEEVIHVIAKTIDASEVSCVETHDK